MDGGSERLGHPWEENMNIYWLHLLFTSGEAEVTIGLIES